MKKPSHNSQVRFMQVLNHLLLILGVAYAITLGAWVYLLISLLTYWTIGVLGINVGYHRLISHRSFKTPVWIEKPLAIIGVLTTVGSPLAWVAVHRQHHRAPETPQDPHSPYIIGNWHAWFGLWDLVRLDLKLVRDLRSDSFYKWTHKNYIWIIASYCVLLALINPWLVIFAYCIPACLCLHSTSAIIVIAHRHGYKTHACKDESRNSWIANIITLGEGWHNNHHAKPYAWNNWEKWWEWDLPSLVIRLIRIKS
jgi:stearoyl-CoA desaturase (delta-9 desaturase)